MRFDEASRVRLSASSTTSPAILRRLAADPSVMVRISLALNPALPSPVSDQLAGDTDARVRAAMARRTAGLTIDTSDDDRQRAQRDAAVANLTAMITEAGERVRATIADTVKDLPNGSRDTILRLAHDPSVMVCGPVIRCSPMLTQEDLIVLIATAPPSSTAMAVAGRPNIGADVSDAIVETSDPVVIRTLLGNNTALIRDATLDALAAQSEEQTDWQEPLVRRPRLPVRAQHMLSEFVSAQLLDTLAARSDLDPAVTTRLRIALGQSLPRDATARSSARPVRVPAMEWARPQVPAAAAPSDEPRTFRARALELHQAGQLDEAAILSALQQDSLAEATAMLAVKADLPILAIERACEMRSASGMVSVAWKAGLSPETAVALQRTLARVAPEMVVAPEPGGAFALSENEMRSHLGFVGAPERGSRAWRPRRLAS